LTTLIERIQANDQHDRSPALSIILHSLMH
jgi:hypothetical protein